jgi:hypothetical protein
LQIRAVLKDFSSDNQAPDARIPNEIILYWSDLNKSIGGKSETASAHVPSLATRRVFMFFLTETRQACRVVEPPRPDGRRRPHQDHLDQIRYTEDGEHDPTRSHVDRPYTFRFINAYLFRFINLGRVFGVLTSRRGGD